MFGAITFGRCLDIFNALGYRSWCPTNIEAGKSCAKAEGQLPARPIQGHPRGQPDAADADASPD
jgi:hypothetical protein